MAESTSARENELFFKQWLRSPKAMGSVHPSSAALGRALARQVSWRRGQNVIELGGGTGAVTKALLEHGIAPSSLFVVEFDRDLHDYLRRSFPGVAVLHADATQLAAIVEELGIEDISTVVSGVPMVTMPMDFQRPVVHGSFAAMQGRGDVIQYSYSPICPVHAKKLDVVAKLENYILWNLPPAAIWRFSPADRERWRKRS